MKKEEILQASRNENQKKDLYQIEVEAKALKLSALGSIILATIFYCLEIIVKGVENYGWYAMIALFCTIVYGYKAIKFKNKFNIIISIIWAIVTIVCITNHFIYIFDSSTIL